MLTIVTYHYIRDQRRERYPRLRALDTDAFAGQVAYLARHHTFVTVSECLAARSGAASLPADAVLLTFDDGYLDHFVEALPVLDRHDARAVFFPVLSAARERRVLEVNKIQLILEANDDDIDALAREIEALVDRHRDEFGLLPWADYVERWAVASRFDDAQTRLVKNLLQRGLPAAARSVIIDELFARHVDADEHAVADEWYMHVDQLRRLVELGHTVGSHGCEHIWLDEADDATTESELATSKSFLLELGVSVEELTVCYPYGGHDDRVVRAARELGYRMGFTVEEGLTDLDAEPLALPRLDTNSLPHHPDEPAAPWTRKAADHGS